MTAAEEADTNNHDFVILFLDRKKYINTQMNHAVFISEWDLFNYQMRVKLLLPKVLILLFFCGVVQTTRVE